MNAAWISINMTDIPSIPGRFTADYYLEVKKGNVPGAQIVNKYGANTDVDLASVPEVPWNGGGLYTGHDATAAETVEIYLDTGGTTDTGSLISSGTATGGTTTELDDSGADFIITDGVAIGNLVINDTKGAHGVITAITADKATVLRFKDGDDVVTAFPFEVGDAYRIVSSTGAGAAVVRLSEMLTGAYAEAVEYIILNGVTPVDTVGTYIRLSRGRVVLSGATDTNSQIIFARQKTTTANVFFALPLGKGSTNVCAWTVPGNRYGYILQYGASILRGNGARAEIDLEAHPYGEAWQSRQPLNVEQTGGQAHRGDIPLISIDGRDDIRVIINTVSANNTGLTAHIDMIIFTRP
jgi:hypothetical protein